MPHPTCYTSSSIGHAPDLNKNFKDRPETVALYWDDAPLVDDGAFLRVIHMCEPAAIFPGMTEHIIANQGFFDVIMTYSPRVLSACPNAVPLRESNCSWIDRKASGSPNPFLHNFGGDIAPLSPVVPDYKSCDVSAKEFSVSFLTSSKGAFPGHILRQQIFDNLPEQLGSLRTWKHRSPPRIDDKRPTLEPYMFSIVVENSEEEGYYTEKLVDALIAKTVPIYWGCPDVDKYFDTSGILIFSDHSSLEDVLRTLSVDRYHNMLPAVDKNFSKALQHVHQWDEIEHWIDKGISKKKDSGVYSERSQSMHTNPQPVPRSTRWLRRKPQRT